MAVMRFAATVEISSIMAAALSIALAQTDAKRSDLSSPEVQAAFNQTLQRILVDSQNHFERLRGARIENRLRQYYYEPKTSLPGASYCRILVHEGMTIYTCEWEHQTMDGYSRLAGSVERALGPEWQKRSETRPFGQQVLFSGEGKPAMQVMRATKTAVVHVIVLPADAPKRGIVTELPTLPDFFHP